MSSMIESRTWPELFTPSHVRDNPLIFACCYVKRLKTNLARTKSIKFPANMPPLEAMKQKVDLFISDLFQTGNDSVHDIRVMNTDAKYHLVKTPEKSLQEAERATKKMYLEPCLQEHRNLSPLLSLS